jgi:type I restriction enzyme M protein
MEMVSKMKRLQDAPLGSRIATVHNGSALFTGNAGGGASNIRQFLIENDFLEAIIQLPNNIFYNTGITTYIWVLSNHKPNASHGKVQLIDASQLSDSFDPVASREKQVIEKLKTFRSTLIAHAVTGRIRVA